MKKTTTAQRKTGSRSKQAGAAARAPAQGKPSRRSTKTAPAPPSPRRPRSPARRRFRPPPPPGFSKGDGKALLLLLVPFALMAVAVGTTQAFDSIAALRRQLAQFPVPQAVVPAAAAPQELASPLPKRVAVIASMPARIVPESVRETARVVARESTLATLPPREQVVALRVRKPRADRCVATAKTQRVAQSRMDAPAVSPATFGHMLARAALAQTRDLVVYTDKYRQIGFPMGDVPKFYGVCTDVVVRAYRALGIDLQVLVHEARIGTGDISIDHRRTTTLRRFFARYGQSIPITDFAEDYLPGDIVTYYRASGRSSQTHIAIVSDVIAASGRPMIVHNRGWGPQLEDALFANTITGHYRFNHISSAEQASTEKPKASSTLR